MNRNELLWSGAVVSLLVLGALSFLPAGLEPPLQPPSVPAAQSAPADEQPWPQWLEGRLQPVVAAPEQAAPAAALPGYSLVGLVEVDGRILAMIAGGGTTRSLAVGGVLDGYEAIAIEADRIVLARDGEEVVLRLDR
tara:strand:+ start:15847 stop:16257 length:411 start_codon:yes stop_codon:yes gene_type:complete